MNAPSVGGGIAMVVIGGGAAALEADNHSACSSVLGQIGQSLSQTTQQQCTVDNLVFYGGIILCVIGAVVLLAALLAGMLRSNHPQSGFPPGWYPDTEGTMRWWDGQQWTVHTSGPQGGMHYPPPNR